MDIWLSLILTYLFFILFCFLIPWQFSYLMHPPLELQKYAGQSKWDKFKYLYYKDTLKLLGIGLPVVTILIVWMNVITINFSWRIALTTLGSIMLGTVIIINQKTKNK
ncbi:hypothetical protein [uncultured Lactobacillus sp.]|uniref:hypothetical protein n=1 Tax=uncultured Lactobacillus sp. TaxID=153152 RepID=UPI00260867D8|nr:hypothetical protein [uncultured Lactobacillus sp.]